MPDAVIDGLPTLMDAEHQEVPEASLLYLAQSKTRAASGCETLPLPPARARLDAARGLRGFARKLRDIDRREPAAAHKDVVLPGL